MKKDREQEKKPAAQEPDARSGKPVRATRRSSDTAKFEELRAGTRARTPRPKLRPARPEPTDVPAEAQRLGAGEWVGTPGATDTAPQSAAGQIEPLGTGKRVRTTTTPPVVGEIEEIDFGGGWAKQNHPRNQSAGLQLGLLQGDLLQSAVQNPALLQSLAANPAAQKLQEKGEHFRHIQDFLQNPALFDLRSRELRTSSTPEEIESRKGELSYQIQVMKSLLAVLTDELNELEQARPQVSAQQMPSTHS